MPINVAGGQLGFQATLETSQFKAQLNRIESDLKGFTSNVVNQGKEVNTLVNRVSVLAAGFFSAQAASSFIQQIISVRSEFQQLEISLATILKSKDEADKLMAQVVDMAARTPFSLRDIAASTKQLLAYGFAADEIRGTLKSLGDVAAGVSQPIGELAYLYGTLRTQGRAYMMDIRQFTGRGIPIVQALADVLGKQKEEILGMVEAGRIGFPEVEKAFQSLTSSGGQFFNLMEKQSSTLNGQISNLGDAFDQMLNDFGKANEGLAYSGIAGLKSLIDNYQKILDILKLVIAAYGAYRAALVLTAIHQRIVAEGQLQLALSGNALAASSVRSAGAMALLNQTLAAIQARLALMVGAVGATTAAIAALGTITYALIQYETAETRSQEAAAAAREKGSDAKARALKEIDGLVKVIKDETASLNDQRVAYEQLQATTNGQLAKYSQLTVATGGADNAIRVYSERLRQAVVDEQFYAEFKGIEEKLKALQEEGAKTIGVWDRLAIGLQSVFTRGNLKLSMKDWWNNLTTDSKKFDNFLKDTEEKRLKRELELLKANNIKAYNQRIALQKKEREAAKTTLKGSKYEDFNALFAQGDVIGKNFDKLLKSAPDKPSLEKLKESVQYAIDALAPDSKDLAKYQAKMEKVSKLIDKYSPKKAAGGKSEAAQTEAIRAFNELKDNRLRFLEELTQAENAIKNKALSDEARSIAEYQQKYEALRKKAQELKLGAGVVERINQAEKDDTGILKYTQETQNLTEEIDKQKAIFEDYEHYRTTVSKEEADKRYGDQLKGFDSFASYLKAQLDKVKTEADITPNLLPSGAVQERLDMLNKMYLEAKEIGDRAREQELADAIASTMTYNETVIQIRKDLAKQIANIEATDLSDNLKAEKIQLAKEAADESMRLAQEEVDKKSQIYRALNENIINYTTERLQADVQYLEAYLENEKTLTIGQKDEIKKRIDMIKRMVAENTKTFTQAIKVAEQFAYVSSYFNDLAQAIGSLNPGLADTLDTLSQVAEAGRNAADAIASFATPDGLLNGIGFAIRAVGGLINIFKKSKESAKEAREEIEAIQLKDFLAEFDLNAQFRERILIQVRLNKLRLEGIKSESVELKKQTEDIKNDYQRVFIELQKQVAVIGQRTEKYGGIFGIGQKTRVVNITESLLGKNYEDLEKLFLSGKLEGKAKELFETLQRLKAEGVNVDKMYKDLQAEKAEIFTGTTDSSLLDSIVEGFREGKKSITDFADTFEEMMQNAIINALKYQTLEAPLKEFYNRFSELAESEGQLSEAEYKELEEKFNIIISAAGTRFEQLQKLSGVKFDNLIPKVDKPDPAKTGIAGGFANASREDINALTGQFNGQRIATLELLEVEKTSRNILIDSLAITSQIEINTRLMAGYLKNISIVQEEHTIHLANIDRKVGSSSAALDATGG